MLIERRFTNLVKKGSRFWNVSGVNADVSLSGAKIELESLAALVNGAIAFDSPEDSKPAAADDTFGLYQDLAHSQRGVIVKLELPSGADSSWLNIADVSRIKSRPTHQTGFKSRR
ncbi:hypothetical protein ACNKHK_08805 [Shigella flexneri]